MLGGAVIRKRKGLPKEEEESEPDASATCDQVSTTMLVEG
jgi:hypothetical protein